MGPYLNGLYGLASTMRSLTLEEQCAQARIRTIRAKAALDEAKADYSAAITAEEAIIARLSHGNAHQICNHCRAKFDSRNRLYDHIREECWATIFERTEGVEWTASLKDYVRRALLPENAKSGWSNSKIREELKVMIHVSNTVSRLTNWDRMDLPQDINPEKLPYTRENHNASVLEKQSREQEELEAARTGRRRVDNGSLSHNGLQPIQDQPRTTESSASSGDRPKHLPKTYPEVFNTCGFTPQELFEHRNGRCFIGFHNRCSRLVFTDGSCSNNGGENPEAGCGFVYQHSTIPKPWTPPAGAYTINGQFYFRLEEIGPFGSSQKHTSNRAELRAVVAALAFTLTDEEMNFCGSKESAHLIIATDSTYVVNGATDWVKAWENNGWKKRTGECVKNRDLWELLLHRLRLLQADRCANISFWHIPREQNVAADRIAKYAASLPPRPKFGIPPPGFLPQRQGSVRFG